MKKRKLNLNKKAITKLTQENLEKLQGGGTFACGSIACCTRLTHQPDNDTNAPQPQISCGV